MKVHQDVADSVVGLVEELWLPVAVVVKSTSPTFVLTFLFPL
jgi:hypothetical protein